jgi:hypothetical protein
MVLLPDGVSPILGGMGMGFMVDIFGENLDGYL